MKIILAKCDNGYCGCDCEDVFFYDNDTEDIEIEEDLWGWAIDNAESYAYVHFGWGEEYSEEDYEEYLENHVNYTWYEATYEEYVAWCEIYGQEVEVKEEEYDQR